MFKRFYFFLTYIVAMTYSHDDNEKAISYRDFIDTSPAKEELW